MQRCFMHQSGFPFFAGSNVGQKVVADGVSVLVDGETALAQYPDGSPVLAKDPVFFFPHFCLDLFGTQGVYKD